MRLSNQLSEFMYLLKCELMSRIYCNIHTVSAHSTALLNFCTQQECEEAKDALTSTLGEEVKVTFTGDIPGG